MILRLFTTADDFKRRFINKPEILEVPSTSDSSMVFYKKQRSLIFILKDLHHIRGLCKDSKSGAERLVENPPQGYKVLMC